jgi:hypothetical protein
MINQRYLPPIRKMVALFVVSLGKLAYNMRRYL